MSEVVYSGKSLKRGEQWSWAPENGEFASAKVRQCSSRATCLGCGWGISPGELYVKYVHLMGSWQRAAICGPCEELMAASEHETPFDNIKDEADGAGLRRTSRGWEWEQ